MQKSPLQYGKIIFQSKVIPHFLPKCSKSRHSEIYIETVGKKKKKAKHGEMRWTPKQ